MVEQENDGIMNEFDSKYTLWKLLQEYKVEIPIIQRDYAQGRKSEDATAIRYELLSSIYNALSFEEPLDFDFVYGTVENGNLYPLDGQQRLTTLYLLHWYIAQKEDRMDEARDVLANFTYTTRASSREFCEMLVDLIYVPQEGEKVSTFIKNESNYFSLWDYDPTISNMLSMLDDIHEKFWDTDDIFDVLTSTDDILTFSYLSMEHYALTDDLYIKMNARGKALSVFENFKAKFIQHMKECGLPYAHFENQIDGAWTDLLWDYRDRNNIFDKQFMNLFCYITEMINLEYAPHQDGEPPFKPNKIRDLIDFYDEESKVNKFYEIMDLWKSKEEIANALCSVFSKKVCEGKTRIFDQDEDILSAIIRGERVDLINRILLYAVIKRFLYYGSDADLETMCDYSRIVRNLMLNYRQFIKKKCMYSLDLRYGRHCIPIVRNFINELFASNNPYRELLEKEFEAINGEACGQEKAKAKLLLERLELKPIIQQLEDFDVFKGTLTNMMKYLEKETLDYLVENIEALFNGDKDSLISRAMLGIYDYGINVGYSMYGNKYYFGTHNDWYCIMTYSGGNEYENFIYSFVKQFMEEDDDSVGGSLQKMIDNAISNIDINSWRYSFLKYENILNKGWNKAENLVLIKQNCTDSTYIIHFMEGASLNGQHIVADYLELDEQLKKLELPHTCYYAQTADDFGTLCLNENCELVFEYNIDGGFTIEHEEEDSEWLKDVFDGYDSDGKKIGKDKIERAIILITEIEKKSKQIYG